MLYHHDNRNRKGLLKKNSMLIVLVAISAFVLLYSPVRNILIQAVYSIAPRSWKAGENINSSVSSFFVANFRSKESLFEENKKLRAEINNMQVQVLDRNLLSEKVMKLEEILGRARVDNRVVANVIVGPRQSPYDVLIIDAGEKEGIEEGDQVVYSGAGVVGEIIETTTSSSKIKIFSSPGTEIPVVVGSSRIMAVAFGRGLGNFEAKMPQDSDVAIGDSVVSVDGNFVFGSISYIEDSPAEPFKRVYFRTPFNITEIQTVEVLVRNHS